MKYDVGEESMNRSNANVLFSKNLFNVLIAALALMAVGLACGGGSKAPDEKQAGPEFVGLWTAKDGSTITIRADGGGDYKIGGSSVTGGSAVVSEKEKTLRITMLGMGSPMKIDKAPQNGEMTIDGIVYKKDGGSTTSDAKLEVPGNEKLQTLVKTTFLDFGDAVQSEDFSDFHKKTAKVWRDSSTPDELNEAFDVFIQDKENYNFKKAVAPLDATFSPAPAIEKVSGLDALVVKGYYPTKPLRSNFELKYAMDDGNWKLIAINIKAKNE